MTDKHIIALVTKEFAGQPRDALLGVIVNIREANDSQARKIERLQEQLEYAQADRNELLSLRKEVQEVNKRATDYLNNSFADRTEAARLDGIIQGFERMGVIPPADYQHPTFTPGDRWPRR